jgi:hypothetical protein
MHNEIQYLDEMIAGVVKTTSGRERKKALQACQWRFETATGQGIRLNTQTLALELCHPHKGMVFDGRDNAHLKTRFFEMALNQPVLVRIISQTVCAS